MCCIFPSSKLQCLRSIPVELILKGSLSWHKDSSFLTLTVMWSQYGKRRIMCSDILIWWFEEAFVSLVTWRNLHNPQTWHACFPCSVLHWTIWQGWTSDQQLNWVPRINRANSNSSYVMNVKWHQMLENSLVLKVTSIWNGVHVGLSLYSGSQWRIWFDALIIVSPIVSP
jgi:hypothetical protein